MLAVPSMKHLHGIRYKIFRDCHCRCFQFLVSFKIYANQTGNDNPMKLNCLYNHKLFVFICTPRDNAHRIQQHYCLLTILYSKRSIHSHCAALHFRMSDKGALLHPESQTHVHRGPHLWLLESEIDKRMFEIVCTCSSYQNQRWKCLQQMSDGNPRTRTFHQGWYCL